MLLDLDFELVIKFVFLFVVLVGRVLALEKLVLNSEQFLVDAFLFPFLSFLCSDDLLEPLSLVELIGLCLPKSLSLVFFLLLSHQPNLLHLLNLSLI